MFITENFIYSELPSSITISEGKYGKCLISNKQFKKNDIIYKGSMLVVPEQKILNEYNLIITNDTENKYTNLKLDKFTHFVKIDDARQIYGFDSYMNHSCNPTVICNNLSDSEYDVIAFRDIEIGDEITCDYALFDYECNGHEIEKCECSHLNCRGNMKGFKNLNLEHQLLLLNYVDQDIFDKFVSSNNLTYVGEINCPNDLEISTKFTNESISHFIFTNKEFNLGDIICTNTSMKLNKDAILLYKLNGIFYISHDDLFIFRQNFKEFLFFDSFMNHSCSPNTKMVYFSETQYNIVAIKHIMPNTELTCDYNCLDNNFTGIKNIGNFEFSCNCKSQNCRKNITS